MNLRKIQNSKNKATDNIVLSEQKKLELVQKLKKGSRVSETSSDKIIDFLSFQIATCYQLSGLKKLTKKDLAYSVNFIFKEIKRNYSAFTSEEIEAAFQNGICGEYGETYNKGLSATAFIFFLKSYKVEKKVLEQSLHGRMIAQIDFEEEEDSQEHIKSLNEDFLKNKYDEFLKFVEEGLIHISNKQCMSFSLTLIDVNSYTSAIEQESQIIITPAQIEWIYKKVDSIKIRFTSSFGRGLEGRENYNKHKEAEKRRLFDRLTLEIHFCNLLYSKTGASFQKFFVFSEYNKTQ